MLNRCREGIYRYNDIFLRKLCLEGWLLHARRIIESFQLNAIDKKWGKLWGLISQHLSHAKPANRTDHRPEKRENPQWDIGGYHSELMADLKKITEKYKNEYEHSDLLAKILSDSNK